MIKKYLKKVVNNYSSNDYQTLNLINLSSDNLIHNYNLFKNLNPKLQIIPVLKANAYGHGIKQVASILNSTDCPMIAVDGYFEASKLIDISSKRLLVLGYILETNFHLLNTKRCSFVVQDLKTIKELNKLGKKVNIHIEINSGMNRLGTDPEQIEEFLKVIGESRNISLEGVMSHLADADNEIDNSFSLRQVEIFDQTVSKILDYGFKPKYIHIAQTAGSTKVTSKFATTMRLGIGLYGLSPLNSKDKYSKLLSDLRPVLNFETTLIKKINLKPGDRVSYNGIFEAKKNMTVGVLPMGYYEGIPRALSNVGLVKYKDQYLKIVGRVCMNHVIVDLENLSIDIGEKIEFISSNKTDKNSVENICKANNLFNYSLVTGLSESTRRRIV
jgi:alanine racemase